MNEKTHAWIIAQFYQALTNFDASRGKDVFIRAARRYGEERGYRMALRALRDGQPLNIATYMAYSEWRPTDASFYASTVASFTPDYENHNARCPWVETFVEVSGWDCAATYCAQVDASIVRGFNPDVQFELIHPLSPAHECRMVFREAYLPSADKPLPHSDDTVRPWSYHCGHLWHAFADTLAQVYADAGDALSTRVFTLFTEAFGADNAALLCSEAQRDFRSIAPLLNTLVS